MVALSTDNQAESKWVCRRPAAAWGSEGVGKEESLCGAAEASRSCTAVFAALGVFTETYGPLTAYSSQQPQHRGEQCDQAGLMRMRFFFGCPAAAAKVRGPYRRPGRTVGNAWMPSGLFQQGIPWEAVIVQRLTGRRRH